jgi:hypothetical protein
MGTRARAQVAWGDRCSYSYFFDYDYEHRYAEHEHDNGIINHMRSKLVVTVFSRDEAALAHTGLQDVCIGTVYAAVTVEIAYGRIQTDPLL